MLPFLPRESWRGKHSDRIASRCHVFFDSCKRASSPPHHLYSGAGGFPIQSVQGRLSETLCQKRRGTTTASTFPSFAPTASPQPRIIWMTGSPISWNLHLYGDSPFEVIQVYKVRRLSIVSTNHVQSVYKVCTSLSSSVCLDNLVITLTSGIGEVISICPTYMYLKKLC